MTNKLKRSADRLRCCIFAAGRSHGYPKARA